MNYDARNHELKKIAVCSEIHTKHINTLCWQNVELLNVKLVGTYSNHWAFKANLLVRIVTTGLSRFNYN